MTTTHDTPGQLSDLIRSVEARFETHRQQERQALVKQLNDIRRTAERLLIALVGSAAAPRGRGLAAVEWCDRWGQAHRLACDPQEGGCRGKETMGRQERR